LQDGSGAVSPADQLITGTAATDTLDNIDNTISGYGRLGAADGLFTLINEAAGTVNAVADRWSSTRALMQLSTKACSRRPPACWTCTAP
jgi:hypothetical protein